MTSIYIAVPRKVYTVPDDTVPAARGWLEFEVMGKKDGLQIRFRTKGTKGIQIEGGECQLTFGQVEEDKFKSRVVEMWTQFSQDLRKALGGDHAMVDLFAKTFFNSWQKTNEELWGALFTKVFKMNPDARLSYKEYFKYEIFSRENLELMVDMPVNIKEENENGEAPEEEVRSEAKERVELSRIVDHMDNTDFENLVLGDTFLAMIAKWDKKTSELTRFGRDYVKAKREFLKWVNVPENPNYFKTVKGLDQLREVLYFLKNERPRPTKEAPKAPEAKKPEAKKPEAPVKK